MSGNRFNQSYIDLVSWCFKMENFNDYVNKNIEEFCADYKYTNNKSWILVSVWNKKYRNLNINTRTKVIMK